MKKTVILVAAIAVMLACVPVSSFAEDEKQPTSVEAVSTDTEQSTSEPVSESPAKDETPYNKPEEPAIEPEYIPVEEIVVPDFKNEMYVNDTQNITATIFPVEASGRMLYYYSSAPRVASVDRTGKVTAISRGKCSITICCDDYSVSYDLNVKIKTDAINVVNKFIVLKPDQVINLEASVTPAGAPQVLEYKSGDESIASADRNGNITAKGIGSTSIMVTNKEQTISVSIIVSTEDAAHEDRNIVDTGTPARSDPTYDAVANSIKNASADDIIVQDAKVISTKALKMLYGTERNLIVQRPDYTLSVNGMDILSIENELSTELSIEKNNNGLVISTPSSAELPGKIGISLNDNYDNYKYMYMYNESSDKYLRVNDISGNKIRISSSGEYLITNKRLDRFRINFVYVLIAVGVVFAISLVYIFTKRKYWFW